MYFNFILVTKLNYPFQYEVEKSIVKNNDAIKIPKEAFAEAKVFLVGTCHLSAISQQEVRDTLQKVRLRKRFMIIRYPANK